MIKKYFFTGLVILLPMIVTVVFVGFAFNVLSKPLQGIIAGLFNYYGLAQSISFLGSANVFFYASKILSFVILMTLILILGSAARMFFVRSFLRFGDFIIHRIPIVNKIYKASQEVVRTLFVSSSNNFSQVVLVPFPHAKALSIGFLTNESQNLDPALEGTVTVFVPGTPNPTIGFMIMFQRKQLIFTDMSVEETLKFIVSCGVALEAKETPSLPDLTFPKIHPSTQTETTTC